MQVAAGAWYEVHRVDPGLSRILESHVAPWMRCNMWLIHGRDGNLLIDSGMGLRPIKPEVAILGEKPVTAVCTHCHFDHIGCAHEFDTRLGHALEAHDYAAPDLGRSCASSWIGAELILTPATGCSTSCICQDIRLGRLRSMITPRARCSAAT